MRHLDKTRRKRPILGVAFLLPACGQAGDGGAVVVAVAVQNLGFLAAMVFVADLADHFERLFVRLGPGVGIVNPGQARHFADQFFGELRARDRPGSPGEIAHFYQLIADRIGD